MDEQPLARWTARQAREAFAGASVVALEELCPPGPILVVAPHPDDESLGCGGLIALAADAGRTVVVAVLTDGAASHPGSQVFPPARLAELRWAEVQAAMAELGAVGLEGFGAPDGRLDGEEAAATAWLQALMLEQRFSAVFAPWEADPHRDHMAAFRIARAAAATTGARLLAYPIWGLVLEDGADAGAASPCSRLEVSVVVDRKARAIAAHKSQTTDLIGDAPGGFCLNASYVSRHLTGYEPFLILHSA